MRKLVAVVVLVGGLLAGAGSAQAQLTPQGGIGDPLTLAASGVILPFVTGGPVGTTALIEVASPVGPNKLDPKATAPPGGANIHLIFFNNTCTRTGVSVDVPETANDIAFFDVGTSVPLVGQNGLVAVAGSANLLTLVPLESPIHSRVYLFNPTDGRSRVLEPIILDTFEFGFPFTGNGYHFWSPLRTAATFFAPHETTTVKTQLTLICPRSALQGDFGAAFGEGGAAFSVNSGGIGFPVIDPPLFDSKGGPNNPKLEGVVFDTNEAPIGDIHFDCDCITPDVSVAFIAPGVYDVNPLSANGTYTELSVSPSASGAGSFTGYKATFTVGSPLNNFFGRLSNGSFGSIFTTPVTPVAPFGGVSNTR